MHLFLLVEISLFGFLVFLLSVKLTVSLKPFVYFTPVVKFSGINIYDINNSFQLFWFSGRLLVFIGTFWNCLVFSCCTDVGFIISFSLFVPTLLYIL